MFSAGAPRGEDPAPAHVLARGAHSHRTFFASDYDLDLVEPTRSKGMNKIDQANREISRTLADNELDQVTGGGNKSAYEVVTEAMQQRMRELKKDALRTYGTMGSTYQF